MRKKIFFIIVFALGAYVISNFNGILLNPYTPKRFLLSENKTEPNSDLTEIIDITDNGNKKITISFAGDCTFGRAHLANYAYSFDEVYDNNDANYFFSNVYDIFNEDSLTIVNFEGTLTDSNQFSDKEYNFKGLPIYANILRLGSVEAVTLANNHTYDYGEIGYLDTKINLEKYDIQYFGNETTAIYNVDDINIGLIGVQTYADTAYIREIIEESHNNLINDGADFTIIYFHWGNELETIPSQYQVNLARFSIDIGIEMVVGAHPHVLQPIEIYKDKTIAYSMGNFSFGGNTNPADKDSFILQQILTFDDDNNINTRQHITIPVSISSSPNINDYRPTPILYSEKPHEFLRTLSKLNVYY